MVTAREEFYYGALRSMKQEYLLRTIEATIPNCEYARVEGGRQNGVNDWLGDQAITLGYYREVCDPEMRELNGETSYEETFISDVCYRVAEILAKGE